MTTPYCSDFVPNFIFYRILSGFHRIFATGVACPQVDAYSSGHLVPYLRDLHIFSMLRPILIRTCRYFTGLCSSNIPQYFLDFASWMQWLKWMQSYQPRIFQTYNRLRQLLQLQIFPQTLQTQNLFPFCYISDKAAGGKDS